MYNNSERLSALSKVKSEVSYVVTIKGENIISVQGHRGIRSYNEKEITLRISKNYIKIVGNNLSIKEINDADITIYGEIFKVVLKDE